MSVAFDALAQVQTWEAARQTEAAVAFPRLSTPRGRKDEPGIAALKQVWERCKAEEKKLAGLLSVSEEEAMEDLRAVAPAMVALLELTADFAGALPAGEAAAERCRLLRPGASGAAAAGK